MIKGFKSKLIVLVGPDGSGKTTAIHELRNLISDSYTIHDRHIRFNNIPRFGHLLYRLKNPLSRKPLYSPSQSTLNSELKTHSYGENIPIWKILIILGYDLFDYLIGYLSLISKSDNSLFVFDRYIYDYYTERDWINTPRWLMRLIMILIPKPYLIVILKNDPVVIYDRKPELSISDITYTQDKIEELLGRDLNIIKLSTDRSPKEIAQSIVHQAEL